MDITISKKLKFFLTLETHLSLVERTIECYIKESLETDAVLFKLTVANEGIIIIDSANGIFALSIASDKTDIEADNGFYSIVLIDSNYPLEDRRIILQGNITFTKGV